MKDQLTDITIVLDRSGSMGLRKDDAIGGFNTLLEDQKKQPGEALFTLVQFDDKYEPNYCGTPVKRVQPLNRETYQPRGSTALLDAIGRTITDTGVRLAALPEADRPGKVLFVIITDGCENASYQFTRTQIHKMISHQRDDYRWQFLFIGTEQDAIAEAGTMGIAASQAINFANTPRGYAGTYAIASDKLSQARSVSIDELSVAMSFTVEDRVEAKKEN